MAQEAGEERGLSFKLLSSNIPGPYTDRGTYHRVESRKAQTKILGLLCRILCHKSRSRRGFGSPLWTRPKHKRPRNSSRIARSIGLLRYISPTQAWLSRSGSIERENSLDFINLATFTLPGLLSHIERNGHDKVTIRTSSGQSCRRTG